MLIAAALQPPDGLGMRCCWLERSTGLPCPGCGLGRSLSCALHGLVGASWTYHPFGIVFLAILTATAMVGVLPLPARERLAVLLHRRQRLVVSAYLLLIASFLAYGAARALCRLI